MLQCARAAMRRWIGHPSTPGSSLEWGPTCVRRVMRLLAIRNGCCTGRFRSPVLAARPRPCETEKAAGKPSPARNSELNATLQTGQPGWRNWQTQRTQNPPRATSWGFDPPSRHQTIRVSNKRSRALKESQLGGLVVSTRCAEASSGHFRKRDAARSERSCPNNPRRDAPARSGGGIFHRFPLNKQPELLRSNARGLLRGLPCTAGEMWRADKIR